MIPLNDFIKNPTQITDPQTSLIINYLGNLIKSVEVLKEKVEKIQTMQDIKPSQANQGNTKESK